MFVNSGMKVWKREEQFMNNVKVQTKLIIVMLATIVALVLCAVISSESMKQLQSKALETLEADERASYDEQIKQQVDNVISLCQTIYDQYQAGVYTEEEAKKLAADEIRQLADSSRETANNIQTINEQVIEAVQGLVVSSEKIVGYINENILPDYRAFVQGGQQYNDDATHIDNTMAEYAGEAQDILATMMEMTEAIEGISRAVEESANGVTDAATNIDSLVQSMSTVNGQMEENSTVAKNLKEESAAFACV